MKKSISKRIRITKTGKVLRRKMGLGHNRSRKSNNQMGRKFGMKSLVLGRKLSTENL
ncbi:MAG: hypothetical protein QMD86_02340 [Patescibacteria group bacterium]|nr:hypothetical protein [Patescibacteria group bacterium]